MAHLVPPVTLIDRIRTGPRWQSGSHHRGTEGQEDSVVCLCGVGLHREGPASLPVPPGGYAQTPAEECGGGGAGVEGQSQHHGGGAAKGTRPSDPHQAQ